MYGCGNGLDSSTRAIGASSRGTAHNALMDPLETGTVKRMGGRVAGGPFLYFKRGE
jgi:hypothetical protein